MDLIFGLFWKGLNCHIMINKVVNIVLNLSNRFLPTVICCPLYHWLEVSHEVDISGASSMSDIFTDKLPTTTEMLGNKSLASKTLRNDKKANVRYHYMKRNPTKNFDCNRGVYMYFLSF